MVLKFYKLIATALVFICSGSCLAAGSQFGNFAPSFYANLSFGFSTYKSKLLASNDTSTGLNYEVGGFAGRNGAFGFTLKNSSTSTSFELNSSSNEISWQDTILKYRISYFYIGPLFTTVNYKANDQGTDILSASGSGIGGNAGILIPINKKGALILDVVSVSPSEVVNKLTTEVNIKSRLDIDLSGSVQITKAIDFLFGYRQQTHQVVTDATYQETYLLTYMGLQFSLSF